MPVIVLPFSVAASTIPAIPQYTIPAIQTFPHIPYHIIFHVIFKAYFDATTGQKDFGVYAVD